MNIIITGATKGIGKAITQTFAADKEAHCFFVCARSAADLQELKNETATNFPQHTMAVFACDVGEKKEVENFAAFILSQTKQPDILINNAGAYLSGSCWNETDGILKKMLDVNLMSAYHLTRALVPAMMQNKRGQIFNMCSIASLQAYANGGSYSISKFALMGFTKNLREELKPYGIKVSGVYPGAVFTDSWKDSGVDEKRIMEATDIAKMIHAAAYLSPQAVAEDIVLRPQSGDL